MIVNRKRPGPNAKALSIHDVLGLRGPDGLQPVTDHGDDPRDLLELLGLDCEPAWPVGRRFLGSITNTADCPFSTSNWTRWYPLERDVEREAHLSRNEEAPIRHDDEGSAASA